MAATEAELCGAQPAPDVELLRCGVGPVDAAASVAARLAAGPAVAALLHVGIAGTRASCGIAPGDLVIGEEALYCDTRSPLVERRAAPDAMLVDLLRRHLPAALVTTIGTSADVAGSTGCDVEAMEGFAVLRAAELAGVPAVELRCVSNEIEQTDRSLWRFDLALDRLSAAIASLVPALVTDRQHA